MMMIIFSFFSDPFVAVTFNGQYLGKTSTLKGTSNPDWTAEAGAAKLKVFPLNVPRWKRLVDCELEVEVFGVSADKDPSKPAKVELLGTRVIRGEELSLVLQFISSTATWFDLRKSVKPIHAQSAIQPKGEVSLKFQDVSASGRRVVPAAKDAPRREELSVYEFVQNSSAETLCVKPLSLQDLFLPEHVR